MLPDKPASIMATNITSRSVVISWEDPQNKGESNEGITGVWIKLKEDHKSSLTLNITTNKVNKYKIANLTSKTTYEIFVAAGNKNGFGEGIVDSFTTSEEGENTIYHFPRKYVL